MWLFLSDSPKNVPPAWLPVHWLFFLRLIFFVFWPHHTFLSLTRKVCMVTQKYVYWTQFKTWAHSIWQNKSGLNFQKNFKLAVEQNLLVDCTGLENVSKSLKKRTTLLGVPKFSKISLLKFLFHFYFALGILQKFWLNGSHLCIQQISSFLETFSRNLLTFYFSSKPAEISSQMESSPYILVILFFGSFYLDWSGYIQHNTIKTQVCSFCF